MKISILHIIITLMISCSGVKSQTNKDEGEINQFKIIKIDSTKNWYLIQIQNNRIKELIVAEKDCKNKFNKSAKIKVGDSHSFRIDPVDAYFNDDDFQKFGFKVDNVDVKSLTEGTIYTSDFLCGLYLKTRK
ncbi:hypothetical protein EGI16_06835 [Chryseobacterium sp. G0240]|uniref:hypothetical protein n=1 Tax=Chryseobacterium sp. G0240 TaxID=2487066 RepID=UPI000F457FF3|nr:hypothetical protein [Chryseobacterium sp. G0240]ROI05033.1 hypothetical protein EGI16_06835 [Chryseobacterium sp. G0240]